MKMTLRILLLLLTLFSSIECFAVELSGNPIVPPSSPEVPLHWVSMPTESPNPTLHQEPDLTNTVFTPVTQIVATNVATGFTINIQAGPGLAARPDALASFQRAAQQWTSRFSNPITVTINSDFSDLGSTGTIGSSSAVALMGPYDVIRNPLVAESSLEGPSNALVTALPTAAEFSAFVPVGISLTGDLLTTKANLKAIGFTGLDEAFGTSDGQINFNTQFNFTFDNHRGVAPGTVDFESVAAHELGHALGFVSIVDTIDYAKKYGYTGSTQPTILDLFRFASTGTNHPTTVDGFTHLPRELGPGLAESLVGSVDISAGLCTDSVFELSTGSYTGDGRQASHWKDAAYTGTYIGIMNPTIGYGQIHPITDADVRALDLIGYRTVPEPAGLTILACGMICLMVSIAFRRRRLDA